MTAELTTEESEKHELERLDDLNVATLALLQRAVERLSIDTVNWRRRRRLLSDTRSVVEAALRVLERA